MDTCTQFWLQYLLTTRLFTPLNLGKIGRAEWILGRAEWILRWCHLLHTSKVKSPDAWLNDQKNAVKFVLIITDYSTLHYCLVLTSKEPLEKEYDRPYEELSQLCHNWLCPTRSHFFLQVPNPHQRSKRGYNKQDSTWMHR